MNNQKKDIVNYIRKKAAKFKNKKIVLPEWEDSRVIEAAKEIIRLNISNLIFIGKESDVKKKIDSDFLKKIEIFDNSSTSNFNKLFQAFIELPFFKEDKKDQKEIRDIILNNKVFVSALLCRLGMADGFVAGAVYTSKEVIKSALSCLDKKDNINRISSSFIIVVPDCQYQDDGFFIFSDCGVNKDPTSSHLVDITIASVELLNSVISGVKPRVALLSYSTKGSSEGASVEKIREALKIIKNIKPNLLIDGELQVDAALVESVAQKKASESVIKGNANILIFPNLESGNISYKLVQRLAKARAIGPVLNGFKMPCSDLSRGCETDDIIDTVAITVIRSSKQ